MNSILPNGPLLSRSSGSFALQPNAQLLRRINRGAVPIRRADHDQVPQQQFSQSAIQLALSRLTLEALAQFSTASCTCSPMILLSVLYWLIREFLAGCAAYVRGMYATPLSAVLRSEDRKLSEEKRINGERL